VDRAAQLLAGWAREAGLEVELVPSDDGLPPIRATQGAGRRRRRLIAHHDTVFPPPTAAERPVTVVGERAFGPGVADMKGGGVIPLHALERLGAGSRGPAR